MLTASSIDCIDQVVRREDRKLGGRNKGVRMWLDQELVFADDKRDGALHAKRMNTVVAELFPESFDVRRIQETRVPLSKLQEWSKNFQIDLSPSNQPAYDFLVKGLLLDSILMALEGSQ